VKRAVACVLLGALSLSALPSLGKDKKEPPPLAGNTYDFPYDGKDIGKPERGYTGRAFVPTKAASEKKALPALVFVHGLNVEKIPFRWIGGGNEGDVRRIVGDLVEGGKIAPMLVLAPTSTDARTMTDAMTSWPGFDLDKFIGLAAKKLDGIATIDKKRIVVAGHSGGGCNASGGVVGTLGAKESPVAALVIDVCMTPDVAKKLAKGPAGTHVVVSYQTLSWDKRGFGFFQKEFEKEVAANPAGAPLLPHGSDKVALRVVEKLTPKAGMAHDAMVPLVLGTWLPKFFPPKK